MIGTILKYGRNDLQTNEKWPRLLVREGPQRELVGRHHRHRRAATRATRRGRPSSHLGIRAVPSAAFGGHPARAREWSGFRESGGRRARGTGIVTGRGSSTVAGGLARHVPVLVGPALEWLQPRD